MTACHRRSSGCTARRRRGFWPSRRSRLVVMICSMKVHRFFRQNAVFVERGDTLQEAAKRMRKGHLSCLPVLEDGSILGIITERDMVEAVARGVPPSDAHVAEYTYDGSVTVDLDEDSSVAATKMLAIGCRHLPVLHEGKLVGMVSLRDLFLTAVMADAGVVVA
jgi:CBS domain-containing protein